MSEKVQKRLIKVVSILMRIGAIAYLFSVLYPYIQEPGFSITFWDWSMRWLLIILLGAAGLLIMVMERKYFLVYGFFVVFLAAMFKMFLVLINPLPIPEVFTHFMIVTVAMYFITRDIRSSLSPKKKRRKDRI